MVPDGFPLGLVSFTTGLAVAVPVLYYSFTQVWNSGLIRKGKKHLTDAKLLLPYLQPQGTGELRTTLGLLAGIAFCVGFCRACNVISHFLLRDIVDQLFASDQIQRPFPWVLIVVHVLAQYLARDTVFFLQWVISRKLQIYFQDSVTTAVYSKMMSLPAEYHENKNSVTTWDTVRGSGATVSSFIDNIFCEMVPDALDLVLGISAFANVCGLRLAVIMAVALLAQVLVLLKTSENEEDDAEAFERVRRKKNELASDAISNWVTAYMFGRLDFEKKRYADAVREMRAVDDQWSKNQWMAYNAPNVVMSIGLVVLCLFVGYDIWCDPERKGSDFIMFLNIWNSLSWPLQNVLKWKSKAIRFFTEIEQLLEIIRENSSVTDEPDAPEFELKNGTICFDGVSFKYDGKSQAAANCVSFDVQGGSTLAIVGETGGGKSSILKLLMRFYDPKSGFILIDCQDIKKVRRESLLQHISIVPQNIGVFNTSILENLRYAKLDATLGECQAVCRAVGLHGKIMAAFKKGYDEIVGERGSKLSGGELQRLAIARALLRDSKIVLLDEAMSSLDSETEASIQAYLQEWGTNRTMVLIAHRLASTLQANMIIAIKEGCIIETGTHEELLMKKGYFFELWERQKLIQFSQSASLVSTPNSSDEPQRFK